MCRVAAASLTLLLAALPASAGWIPTADTLTWIARGDLAVVQEARDAVLWERDRQAFAGALIVAAMPNISVQDNGDGSGTIRMDLPRPAADSWLQAWAVDNSHCGESPTNQEVLDCADEGIRGDLKRLVLRFRESQVTPPTEPELEP